MLAELAPHLPLELDFRLEAANAARCREFFAPGGGGSALAGQVVVPAVHAELSSTRVLTMGFEEGVSVTDVAGIAEMRLRPHAVARQLSECFCAMIFGGGFVHCDPHPGNVLVRPMPGAAAASSSKVCDRGYRLESASTSHRILTKTDSRYHPPHRPSLECSLCSKAGLIET